MIPFYPILGALAEIDGGTAGFCWSICLEEQARNESGGIVVGTTKIVKLER